MATQSQRITRVIAALFFCGLIVFTVLQVVTPKLKNPPVTADLQAPPEVKRVLRNSCYSCHSNETALPIYDRLVPAYWLVSHDVLEARKHLNFSEIASLPAAQQNLKLFEAVNQIQLGAMPLPRYLKVHPGAALSPADLMVFKNYVASAITIPTKAKQGDAETEYRQWLQSSSKSNPVALSPNGIAMPAGYRDWVPISSTERWDSGQLRQILGNDIAVTALAKGEINPWPDGAEFAKVAWLEEPDGHGGFRAGKFWQVEFMLRDSKQYASTKGWGWARWRGSDLKPYGKNAKVANECISCHAPVRNDDYVYTRPFQGQR